MFNTKKCKEMKNIKAIIAFIIISLFIGMQGLFAQATTPGNPPGSPQAGDQPIGGGAPVGSGLVILLSLGAGYGAKKIYNYNKKREDLEE